MFNMATLAKLLQVDMGLPDMAKRLAAAGRKGDTILAHINPREAKLLKKHGGSGKINPETGIMEFAGEDYMGEDPAQQKQAAADVTNRSSGDEVSAYPTAGVVGYTPPEAGPANTISSPGPSVAPPAAAVPAAAQQGQLPAVDMQNVPANVAADYNKQMSAGGGGFIEGLKNFGNQLGDLNKALSPVVPYLKGAGSLVQGIGANNAANDLRTQAAANEAEIRSLAAPYKQQGEQLVALGQAGGLTPQQQKQLEIQRAVASQQMANSGVTGGTAQQQLEANLQQQASAFAQQNIDQGMKLLGFADKYIQDAITTGYAQNKDAYGISQDFYKAIGQFLVPESQGATSQANAAPKP